MSFWSYIVKDKYTETRGGTANASKYGSPQMHETRDTISPVAGDRGYNVSSIEKANHWLFSLSIIAKIYSFNRVIDFHLFEGIRRVRGVGIK